MSGERASLVRNAAGQPTKPQNIIYAVVAKGSTILADETLILNGRRVGGNFATITNKLLPKFPQQKGKYSYVWEQYMFHVVANGKLLFLCLADKEAKRRITFGFLSEIQNQFTQNFGSQIAGANAYQMSDAFAPQLQQIMQRFNNPANDKLSHAKERVDDVKGIMIDNIAKIMERGEQLDILVEQSANLTSDAADFKYEADDLRQRMCRQHARLIIILSIVGAVVLLIVIIAIIVGVCTQIPGACAAPKKKLLRF